MKRCWLAIFVACACSAQWPSPQSAREAYDFVQGRRGEARKLFGRGDPQGIEKGIQVSKDTLLYLDQPLVRNLAAGDVYLGARRSNVFLDLAEAHALQGKTRECLDYLRQVLILAPDPKVAKYLESARSFNTLHANPEFNDIVRRFRQYDQFWDSSALSTPFRDNISDAEKLAGLGKFWSEVKYNFGFPDKLLDVDWDKLYLDWIPRVLATKSTGEYYRELKLLCARLEDGHTGIVPPTQLDIWSKPPLRTGLIEGHVMILEVMNPSVEIRGVEAGMEIVAVDGEPAVAYAKREIEPYVSASTPQDREIRTFSSDFLRGPAARPVVLRLRDAAGHESEREVARSGFKNSRSRPGFEWRLLAGNIGYVALNRFDQQEVATRFGQAFREIAKSSALILDLRQNGGGSSGVGFAILPYLLDQPAPFQRQVMRNYNPTNRAREGVVLATIDVPGGLLKPKAEHYRNPVVVLTSAATYSAAEDFMVVWKTSGRGKTIGEPTGGSTGQPVLFTLPGGGRAQVCTKRDTYPDGSEWEGVGIQPDILVRPTVADVIAGRDTVLERAIEYLKTAVEAQ